MVLEEMHTHFLTLGLGVQCKRFSRLDLSEIKNESSQAVFQPDGMLHNR